MGRQQLSLRALLTARLRLWPKHEMCLQPKSSVARLMLLAGTVSCNTCLPSYIK